MTKQGPGWKKSRLVGEKARSVAKNTRQRGKQSKLRVGKKKGFLRVRKNKVPVGIPNRAWGFKKERVYH